MTHSPIPPLGQLGDEELATLAQSWRTRAGYGEREAFGIAHALEVELRRRTRNSYLLALPMPKLPPPRPWWKFWRASAGQDDSGGPMSAT